MQGEPVTKKQKGLPQNLTFLFKFFMKKPRRKVPKEAKDWVGPEMGTLLREDLEVCTSALPLHHLCTSALPPPPLCTTSAPPLPCLPLLTSPPPPPPWQEGGLAPWEQAMDAAVERTGAPRTEVTEIGTLKNNQMVPLRNDEQADALVESMQLLTSSKKAPQFYIVYEVNPARSNRSPL